MLTKRMMRKSKRNLVFEYVTIASRLERYETLQGGLGWVPRPHYAMCDKLLFMLKNVKGNLEFCRHEDVISIEMEHAIGRLISEAEGRRDEH
ncbi:MAG: hypothetical protein IJJ33_19630 [Victivallales bacterium]|nr:hypothetical protein [Victivallales bacterium]